MQACSMYSCGDLNPFDKDRFLASRTTVQYSLVVDCVGLENNLDSR